MPLCTRQLKPHPGCLPSYFVERRFTPPTALCSFRFCCKPHTARSTKKRLNNHYWSSSQSHPRPAMLPRRRQPLRPGSQRTRPFASRTRPRPAVAVWSRHRACRAQRFIFVPALAAVSLGLSSLEEFVRHITSYGNGVCFCARSVILSLEPVSCLALRMLCHACHARLCSSGPRDQGP